MGAGLEEWVRQFRGALSPVGEAVALEKEDEVCPSDLNTASDCRVD